MLCVRRLGRDAKQKMFVRGGRQGEASRIMSRRGAFPRRHRRACEDVGILAPHT